MGTGPVLQDPEVQKGLGGAVGVPVTIEAIKKPINDVLEQVTGVSMFSDIASYLQTALSILSVTGIVIGVGYAGYAWYKSRKTYTGTKAENPVQVEPEFEGDLVL